MVSKKYFMRWFSDKSNVGVKTPIKTLFDYEKTILQTLNLVDMKSTVEFIDEQNEKFLISAQEVRNVLGYVIKEINNFDYNLINTDELEKLIHAAPWDFWKNKEIQNIVNKIRGINSER